MTPPPSGRRNGAAQATAATGLGVVAALVGATAGFAILEDATASAR